MSQPFSSMNKDNLHHPEPEQPDNGPELEKHAGLHTSSLWELFTEDVNLNVKHTVIVITVTIPAPVLTGEWFNHGHVRAETTWIINCSGIYSCRASTLDLAVGLSS